MINERMKWLLLIIILSFTATPLFAQQNLDSLFREGPRKAWSPEQYEQWYQWMDSKLAKPTANGIRQNAIMNGNKITTEIWNYGSISSPGNCITDIVWNGLGYGFEYGPFVAAEVPVPKGSHPDVVPKRDEDNNIVTDQNGDTVWVAHVISDGLITGGGETSPDLSRRWGWQPLARSDDGVNVYLNQEQNNIPTSDDKDTDQDGKPDSWPSDWYNENLRDYVWPGALGQGATNADKEAFFVMDDRDNLEFDYFPYKGDSTRRGLGLEVEARIYQWTNPLAEDALFLIYKIKNKGHYDLNEVIFAMWGDPHIGGCNDYSDDWANFDTQLDMTFSWDEDGESDIAGKAPGYMGYKFLESPGLANDGKDNDNDGMVDESWTNGIDDDNDWDVDNDDVGIDGVANTGDLGEGDGEPTAGDPFDITKPGEPNFEFTDIDESDMIGLTSFAQPQYDTKLIQDDEKLWTEHLQPGNFDITEVQGDYVFLYGSGKFTLKSIFKTTQEQISEAIKRFSIALILGENRKDLVQNAQTVQEIYNIGYQFAKPPAKPHVTAVPGDRQVTLYWDDIAEKSYDPVSEEEDFEGYVIYRSTDPGFADAQTITDVNGNKFLFEPLETVGGADARFDLDNEYSGPSKTPYTGRGISYYLGDNVGLRHTFVDSNNVINGQTYFYAVVSYDHGSDSLGIPPSECSKIVTFDPTTSEYTFDVNTARVIPKRRSAGYVKPRLSNGVENATGGGSTGSITVELIDEMKVQDNDTFRIEFADTMIIKQSTGQTQLEYSVEDKKPVEETFISFFDTPVSLTNKNLNDESIKVTTLDGTTTFQRGLDYEVDSEQGTITVFSRQTEAESSMEDDTDYRIIYTHFPIFRSTAVDSQLTNPIFDGIRLIVQNKPFGLNEQASGWSPSSETDLQYTVKMNEDSAKAYPFDYEIQFASQVIDSSINDVGCNFQVFNLQQQVPATFYILERSQTRNNLWDPGEHIFILEGGVTPSNVTWDINFIAEDTNYVAPTEGDLFSLITDKPFKNGDAFRFTTEAAKVNKERAKNEMDDICVVPNPYVATNVIEERNTVSRTERGYRRIYFDHLPAHCTIRIYTTAGELVRVLEHNSTIDDGKEYWDLLTKDNMEVAYGLYFYHVEAPGIGSKVGKFAIIK
ncbi:MAG: hypothetical protein GF313_16820 [Caldithrix sp.]|nr:hypothetical protein [Caldithrix sp.]